MKSTFTVAALFVFSALFFKTSHDEKQTLLKVKNQQIVIAKKEVVIDQLIYDIKTNSKIPKDNEKQGKRN